MRARCVLLLAVAALRAEAQVFQVQGGGSSLFAGYGGVLNVWGNGYEGSLGVGYLDGLKVGVSARRLMGQRDTLRLGNDLLPLHLETDVFSGGGVVFAQGASIQRRRGRTQSWIFAGASATALAAPTFGAQRPVHAMGYARVRHDFSRQLFVTAHGVATERQTLLGTVGYAPAAGVRASSTLGLGNNAPYGAIGFDVNRPSLEVKASLVGMGRTFRRTAAPMPLQTELERENALVVWKPRPGWSLGMGRQHFRQDSAFAGIPQRADLTMVMGSALLGSTSLAGGTMWSESGNQANVSSYLTTRHTMRQWLQGELYLLRVWEPGPSRGTTPVLLLRESITPQLSLLQTITRDQGRTSVNFGGTVARGLNSLSVDYQVAHSPYLSTNPFIQTMGVNARLHLRGFTVSIGSFVTPDGRVHYSAQGNTFLYRGASAGGAPDAGVARVRGYLASGRVIDETGAPVDGAALEIGGELVYTDSRGRFFVRRPSRNPVRLRVVVDDFLTGGTWEVVDAPDELRPVPDDRAVPAVIVVRRLPQRG
jgi:hypothetical protein